MNTDPWHLLKQYTNARIAMGRSGTSLPTKDLLEFRLAHSLAKDAIYSTLDIASLENQLLPLGLPIVHVKSQVHDRNDYLRNPNKGRLLDLSSRSTLEQLNTAPADLCLIVADGLSAEAVNKHAVPVIQRLLTLLPNFSLAPLVLAEHSRVALSDAIGELLHARATLILIGERPGLTSPHSMGAYLTYGPKVGNTDEKRNCVSNIQPEGLPYDAAAAKIAYLLEHMLIRQISGIHLKDEHGEGYLNV